MTALPTMNPDLLVRLARNLPPLAPGLDLPATYVATVRGRRIYHPLLWVEFELAGRAGNVPALVDTGADRTLVGGWVARTMGVRFADLPDGSNGHGEAGAYRKRLCPGHVAFGGWRINGPLEVAPEESLRYPWIILGRADFMRHYRVSFDWTREPPTFSVR